jgi:hypothetical protein
VITSLTVSLSRKESISSRASRNLVKVLLVTFFCYLLKKRSVTDREALASGLATKVPIGHVAHSRDSD